MIIYLHKCRLCLLLVCCFAINTLVAQHMGYQYQQKLIGISNTWHAIELPNTLFGKVKSDFSDIRILGITESNDTVEAPYLLRWRDENVKRTEEKATIINTSKNENGYYITLTLDSPQVINQLFLSIANSNYDWLIAVEESHDQKEWYTIVENYRILSIANEETNFSYSSVHFNTSQYAFYRIHFNSAVLPTVNYVSLIQDEKVAGNFRHYTPINLNEQIEPSSKISQITFDLGMPLLVNSVSLNIEDTVDYYRNYTLYYVSDSIQTDNAWQYQYTYISEGVINSLDDHTLYFTPIIGRKFKLEIQNKDNQPLHVTSIKASGYVYELIARFTEKATYYLCYSNPNSKAPEYDLGYFENKIPQTLVLLNLGEIIENQSPNNTLEMADSWKISTVWLWVIMSVIIITLGWFSFKMIKNMD